MEAFNNEMIKIRRIDRNEKHGKTIRMSKRCKRFIALFFRCLALCKKTRKNTEKHEKTRKCAKRANTGLKQTIICLKKT